MLGSISLIWALIWKFLRSCCSFTAPHNPCISHQITLHNLVGKKDDGERPKGLGRKIKPPNSFTEMSVEHTHRSIRQWKWHSRHVFFPPLHTKNAYINWQQIKGERIQCIVTHEKFQSQRGKGQNFQRKNLGIWCLGGIIVYIPAYWHKVWGKRTRN